MNRAAQRLQLFSSEADYNQFVALLRRFCDRTKLEMLAYCIMPNHYHVLAHGGGEQLTRCFHEVDRLWALGYNERRNGRGHVFQGPFLSFPQRSAGWVIRTSAYIHLNPLGRLTKKPQDYPWSSCREYLGLRNGNDWIQSATVLGMVDPDPVKARASYQGFLVMRAGFKRLSSRLSGEENLVSAAALELAASVKHLALELRVAEEDARRFAAYYGRMTLRLAVGSLAAALEFPSGRALSEALHRMKLRARKEPGYKGLLDRAAEALEAPPPTQ